MRNRIVKEFKNKIFAIAGNYLRKRNSDISQLPFDLWNLNISKNGNLQIAEHSVKDLAKQFETPLYIVDKETVERNCRKVVSCFNKSIDQYEVFFSYKTNPLPGFLKIVHNEGIGAEVTSEQELWLALKMGVIPSKIIYDGRGKSIESLETAIESGIRLINIDSFKEINDISEISKRKNKNVDVGIRVISDIGWQGQFGFALESGEALEAVKLIKKSDRLNFKGLHVHLGTSLSEVDIYLSVFKNIFKFIGQLWAEMNIKIDILDIGGGFAVPTIKTISSREKFLLDRFDVAIEPPNTVNNPKISDYATIITKDIGELCQQYNLESLKVFLEPGRMISSSSQFLVLKVIDLKERNGNKIAILDGGINLAHPIYSEYHEAFVANRMLSEAKSLYMVVGPSCNPADILFFAKYLPELEIGDLIVITDAGAYFISFADNFCFPKPNVVVVDNKKYYIARKKETFDYIFYNDVLDGHN